MSRPANSNGAADSSRHGRLTELFQRASELPADARGDFLRRECGGDQALLAEVEELLALDVEEPLILQPAPPPPSPAHGAVTWSGELLVGPDDPLGVDATKHTGALASRLMGRRWQRGAVAGLLIAAVALGSYWVHQATHASLETVRANELATVRDATVQAVEIWVEERMVEARRWAADPEVVAAMTELAAAARSAPAPDADELVRSSPAQQRLVDATSGFFDRGVDIVAFDRQGRSLGWISADGFRPGYVGTQLNAFGVELVYRAFERGGLFLPSSTDQRVLDEASSRTPNTWVVVPVVDDEGRSETVLCFGQGLATRFSEILAVGDAGQSGETYAFEDSGFAISQVRDTAQLAGLGLIPEGESSAILSLQVRDPGGDLRDGYVPELPAEARQLTAAVARAVGSRNSAVGDQQGVLTTPYRNYAGAQVIGAWRWLPEYDLGVVTEMEAREAFAPLRYVELIIAVVAGTLLVALAAAFVSSVTAVRLRHQVHEARRLGHYTLLEKIGEGGMATVYRARHSMLKRPTAVKVLRPEQTTRETLARFEREVQLAANLTHPNTVEIHDYGRAPDGTFYYAMEYVDGITLDQLVSEEGEVPPGRTVFIMEQVCGSLAEAHAAGLVHRDIKPLNIMLCRRGLVHDVVKVLDFGLVKSTLLRDTKQLTRARGLRGTLLYMAPERVHDPDNVDARADIFAIGAVLYFLLTGRHAFDGEGDVDMLYRVVNQDPPAPALVARQSVPAALDALVMECLAKDPRDRPGDVLDLAERLRAIEGIAPWTQAEAAAWWDER